MRRGRKGEQLKIKDSRGGTVSNDPDSFAFELYIMSPPSGMPQGPLKVRQADVWMMWLLEDTNGRDENVSGGEYLLACEKTFRLNMIALARVIPFRTDDAGVKHDVRIEFVFFCQAFPIFQNLAVSAMGPRPIRL